MTLANPLVHDIVEIFIYNFAIHIDVIESVIGCRSQSPKYLCVFYHMPFTNWN